MTRRPPMPLAARVAEKVMGWEVCKHVDCSGCDSPVYYLHDFAVVDGEAEPKLAGEWIVKDPRTGREGWDPLANPADLMDVIEAMRERGFDCNITVETWGALVEFFGPCTSTGNRREPSRKSQGDWRAALARAVCRAALEAVK